LNFAVKRGPTDIALSVAAHHHGVAAPVFMLSCTSGPLTGQSFVVTDPGRALISGKCADIGKLKGPILRGLAGTRREQVREATARHRKRRKRGFLWRPIVVTKAQLDQLEERGYLNPGDRGTRADECEAIASFLTDSLAKSR
jgi:hypothetical protein